MDLQDFRRAFLMSDGHARWRARRPCDSISIAVTSDSSAMVLSGLIDSISSICWNQNVNQRSVHRAESISIKYYQMTQCDSGFFFCLAVGNGASSAENGCQTQIGYLSISLFISEFSISLSPPPLHSFFNFTYVSDLFPRFLATD